LEVTLIVPADKVGSPPRAYEAARSASAETHGHFHAQGRMSADHSEFLLAWTLDGIDLPRCWSACQ